MCQSRPAGRYIPGNGLELTDGEFSQNEHETAQTEALLNQEVSWDFPVLEASTSSAPLGRRSPFLIFASTKKIRLKLCVYDFIPQDTNFYLELTVKAPLRETSTLSDRNTKQGQGVPYLLTFSLKMSDKAGC